MELITAHTLDNILSMVSVRQLVLSLPKWIRYFTSRDSELLNKVLKMFIDAIEQQFKNNVKGVSAKAQIGAITFIQRFGSSLNLHVHYHTLVMEVLFYHDEHGCIKTVPV